MIKECFTSQSHELPEHVHCTSNTFIEFMVHDDIYIYIYNIIYKYWVGTLSLWTQIKHYGMLHTYINQAITLYVAGHGVSFNLQFVCFTLPIYYIITVGCFGM